MYCNDNESCRKGVVILNEVCPNHCRDGFIINPYTHKREICSFCKGKREEEVKSGTAIKDLNLPDSFTNTKFEPESVFPSYVLSHLEKDSVIKVSDVMQKLVQDASIGVKPNHSMLFNLGIKVVEDNFLCPLILKSYLSGLKTVPIIDVPTLRRKRYFYELGTGLDKDDSFTFEDILESDMCVVVIDAGSDHMGVLAVKGLMQLRARKQKATIILTHLWNRDVANLQSEDDIKSYGLATPYSIEYIKKEEGTYKKEQYGGIGLTKKEFEAMKSGMNIL